MNIKKETKFYALSGIRTRDPSNQLSSDIPYTIRTPGSAIGVGNKTKSEESKRLKTFLTDINP